MGDPCAETERIEGALVSRRGTLVGEKVGVRLPVDCIMFLGSPATAEFLVGVAGAVVEVGI
jgi:hypothetical protein